MANQKIKGTIKKQARQGDVLVEKKDSFLKALQTTTDSYRKRLLESFSKGNKEAIKRDGQRVVLAYGEATGHAHALSEKGVELTKIGDITLLSVKDIANLVHEEHEVIKFDNNFKEGVVITQKEFSPDLMRNVAD